MPMPGCTDGAQPEPGGPRCHAVHFFRSQRWMRCLRRARPSNHTYISRCLGNVETLHLTLFVELRCPASHRFRRWCAPTGTTRNFIHNCMLSATIAHSHIVSAALEITPIADVACVHNHIEVGTSCSALILIAADEPRTQPA